MKWYVSLKIKDLSRPKGEVFNSELKGFEDEEAANQGAWAWIDAWIKSGLQAVQISYKVCRN